MDLLEHIPHENDRWEHLGLCITRSLWTTHELLV